MNQAIYFSLNFGRSLWFPEKFRAEYTELTESIISLNTLRSLSENQLTHYQFFFFFLMEQTLIIYKNSRINYSRFGNGPANALCFHGFGEGGDVFGFLAKYAGDQYTFHAIDLPFHGKTEWNEGLTFTISDLIKIIEQILYRQSGSRQSAVVQSATTCHPEQSEGQKLSLIGFSLGGRIALSLYQAMSEKFGRLVLLAPDGLKVNFWYWFTTQTWLGNKLFALTMKYPGWFFGILKLLNKLGLVNTSIFKFVNYYIGDKEVRQKLYQRWTTMRTLNPKLSLIKSYIRKNNTIVRLIYGHHDRIILSTVGEKFRKGIEQQSKLIIIHAGHQVLHEIHIREILPALLDDANQ